MVIYSLFLLSPFLKTGIGAFFGIDSYYKKISYVVFGIEEQLPAKKYPFGIGGKIMLEFESAEKLPSLREEVLLQTKTKCTYSVGFFMLLDFLSFKRAGISISKNYKNYCVFFFIGHEIKDEEMTGCMGSGIEFYYAELLLSELYIGVSKNRKNHEKEFFVNFKVGFLR